jgi:hypothetical protein
VSEPEPNTVFAGVAENCQTSSFVEAVEERIHGYHTRRTEYGSALNYGVGVLLFSVLEFLQAAIPAGNLNVVEVVEQGSPPEGGQGASSVTDDRRS